MEKTKRAQSKNQMRNLAQYRDLSEEDFESLWGEKTSYSNMSKDLDQRVNKKIEEFGQDYDLDDLKINDRETLRSLVIAILALEDYEQIMFDIRSQVDIDRDNINVVDRISKIISDTRKDISRLQEDLNITRKIRKMDKESSVISYISNLKEQARKYYEEKMSYVFCECGMLLGTIWTLYPEENNTVKLTCHRKLEDGSICGKVTKITTKELMERRGTNRPEITPESLL